MRWRGRRRSSRIEDRRGKPDDPSWAWLDPRGWWARWRAKPDYDALDEDNEAALDRYVSRKDRP